MNCAMARSKALIGAVMPVFDACALCLEQKVVYLKWNGQSVGIHSVSNTRCHSISVDDCAKTENLYTAYEAVSGPCPVLEPLRMR
jgi:hypothetical protein